MFKIKLTCLTKEKIIKQLIIQLSICVFLNNYLTGRMKKPGEIQVTFIINHIQYVEVKLTLDII